MIFKREPYQDLIHDHVVDRDRSGVFAGIGLGKTAGTLSALHTLRAEGCMKAALVIAPMRVANLTWPNEINKWDQFREEFKVERLRDTNDRPSGKADIYVTNYERLGKIQDLSFCNVIVFDELTKAKGNKSERINNFRPLLRQHRRIGLTGTPRPNSLLELHPQIRLLDDGKRLGPSFSAFQNCWFTAEDYNQYKWLPNPDAEKRIYEKIHDLVITLKSSDYLNIPDTIVEDIEVPLPGAAHSLYKMLERELMVLLNDNEQIVAVNAAVLVNKLLQICSGAIYTNPTGDLPQTKVERAVGHVHDAKIGALKRLLLSTHEPALIACNFIHERKRIVAKIPGAVDAHEFKGDIEDAWNSGAIKYLVADPRGLGHGLNMQQGGRDTIWFSPCWSRELYDQFNGRTARKGQEKAPRVFRITCPGTIDDAVIEALRVRGEEQGELFSVLTNFRLQGLTFN